MSDWAKIREEYLGKVFIKKGTKQRYYVADTTFGGSLVLVPYRLRNSQKREYRTSTIPLEVVKSTMLEAHDGK